MSNRWKPGRVTIDTVLGVYESEIDQLQRWNGFACPRFTREVAEQVARDSEANDEYLGWRWEGDTLVLMPNEPVAGYSDEEHFTPDEDGRYHVGSWAWTWQEANCVAIAVLIEIFTDEDPTEFVTTRLGFAKQGRVVRVDVHPDPDVLFPRESQ